MDNLSNDVGKKIVEALKMQTVQPNEGIYISEENNEPVSAALNNNEQFNTLLNNVSDSNDTSFNQNYIDNAFEQSLSQNLGNSFNYNIRQDDVEYPTNVAILKQLISKLPAGVSKQTGAVIIQQTMEALGISINGVLQEAKQVQKVLNAKTVEAQNSIAEYKKQINIAETRTVQYQRQSALLGDIINLFYQSGITRK